MNKTIDLSFLQVVSAYIFVLLLMVIVKIKGIPREKEIIISTIRMTLQLVLVGYLLAYVFENSNPIFSILIIAIMEAFAIFNIYKRVKGVISLKLKKIIAYSMLAGTLSGLVYFILVVLQISPWYEPRYIIPIAGMLIGNSMTGISLGVNRLVDGMKNQKQLVETSLMLGATPQLASKNIVDDTFDAAILPTINSMVGMGIVFLPGMMTGQIIAGASPIIAIKYQIAIMMGILGSVTLTVFFMVNRGAKTFFNSRKQLEL